MWIVRLALNRPYTFVVLSLLIVILSGVAITQAPVDIFPEINIPVVSVILNYTGLSPLDMQDRLATVLERNLTTTVNDIEHMEAQSYHGLSVIKVFFQPGTDPFAGMAQIAASSQSAVRGMPPGTIPPFMIAFSAADVPILQLGLSSKTLSELQLQDLASNFLRTQLATVQGAELPGAYGGKSRLITVDLDPQKLLQRSISGSQVVNAVNAQNLVVPQGTAKIGSREYDVALNSSTKTVAELNDVPLEVVNGAMVYLRDVAYVHDGASFQTNIARTDGHRGVLQVVLKHGKASTLDVVARIRAALPKIAATLPPELQITPLSDQSVFVRAAVNGVLREAIIAAGLTALLILLFLGSWRSTLVVSISIPLSILTSLLVMSALGETINIMTLGGLALAVGILVDDATVEIENINRLLPEGKSLRDTILTGAQQIATPAFVATLSICIVFVPIFFLKGVPGFLFRPLAEAVVFAMLASYFLSRTIVPTLVMYFFLAERRRDAARAAGEHKPGVFHRFHQGFEKRFDHFRDGYVEKLEWCLNHRLVFGSLFLAFLRRHAVPATAARHRPLPHRGRGPDSPPPSRADRHARRGDGGALRPGGAIAAPADRQGRPRGNERQHRLPQQRDQRDARQQRRDRHGRCRDSHLAHARPPDKAGGLHARVPADPASSISRHGFLFPAGGHRQSGAQFRIARAD